MRSRRYVAVPVKWGRRWVRRLECESAMGALAVVVLDVDAQDVFEVAAAEDE
jgi:hypothetical protein